MAKYKDDYRGEKCFGFSLLFHTLTDMDHSGSQANCHLCFLTQPLSITLSFFCLQCGKLGNLARLSLYTYNLKKTEKLHCL